MEKKYRLLENDTIRVDGSTLYRIEALRDFADIKLTGYYRQTVKKSCKEAIRRYGVFETALATRLQIQNVHKTTPRQAGHTRLGTQIARPMRRPTPDILRKPCPYRIVFGDKFLHSYVLSSFFKLFYCSTSTMGLFIQIPCVFIECHFPVKVSIIVFPQCGQVIVFERSFSSATSSETDIPMMSAISCNLSNGVFPLRSCDKEDCDMPCFLPLLFVISDASLSSVHPCSFITFFTSINNNLYYFATKIIFYFDKNKKTRTNYKKLLI